MEIASYISKSRCDFLLVVPIAEIIKTVLYKLKIWVQWGYLPVSKLFSEKVLAWQSVYFHFSKWGKSGAMDCWMPFLSRHHGNLVLSIVDLDGSHTSTNRDGECVAYQGLMKDKIANVLCPYRDEYFDKELYRERYAEVCGNARMDGFWLSSIRFDITTLSCEGLNHFSILI
jgi:hypothetical protein